MLFCESTSISKTEDEGIPIVFAGVIESVKIPFIATDIPDAPAI